MAKARDIRLLVEAIIREEGGTDIRLESGRKVAKLTFKINGRPGHVGLPRSPNSSNAETTTARATRNSIRKFKEQLATHG